MGPIIAAISILLVIINILINTKPAIKNVIILDIIISIISIIVFI
jgi:hypothetical protein